MTLLDLFLRCLDADYLRTGTEDGNYAIEKNKNTIYLFFQWSNGRRDWYNNLDFPVKPYRRMDSLWFCHRGFLRVWKSMRDEIEAKVSDMLAGDTTINRIICVGFSHGAALALFATEDMSFLYGNKLSIRGVGFGCPRVLWGFIPGVVLKRLHMFMVVRDGPDIVTHVPPAFMGYRHIGTILNIGSGKNLTPVGAHHPESYVDSLSAMKVDI